MSLAAALAPLVKAFRLAGDAPRALPRRFDPQSQRDRQRHAAQAAFLETLSTDHRAMALNPHGDTN